MTVLRLVKEGRTTARATATATATATAKATATATATAKATATAVRCGWFTVYIPPIAECAMDGAPGR